MNDVDDWISIKEATTLLPSCRPGKRLHLCTIYRWIEKGRLDCWRNGRWRFVRRDQVLALMEQVSYGTNKPKQTEEKRISRAEQRQFDKMIADALKDLES